MTLNLAPLRSITEEEREWKGSGEVGEQSPEAIWSRREEPPRKEAAVSRSRSVGKNVWQIPTTIYQILTGNEGNSRDLHPRLSLCKCGVFPPLSIDVSPLLGKTFTIAAKLLVCLLSYPALTPSLESAWWKCSI